MGCCCSVPRHLVSKKKLRIKDDTPQGGVDLDLAVVHKQVVCMGLPAEGIEAWYRNPYDEVVDYLDFRFKDQYFVYNLCSEKQHVYSGDKFHGRVAFFPFPDHHACPLAMLPQFIKHALAYLSGDPSRVAVIHCKAGKGRTGAFACCLLMQLDPRLANAGDAVTYYGKARTQDGRGLTIPSQIRYVEYYEQLMRCSNGEMPAHIPVLDVKSFTLRGILPVENVRFIQWETSTGTIVIDLESKDTLMTKSADGADVTIDVSHVDAFRRIQGDIRINLRHSLSSSWAGALSIHTLFAKKGYSYKEMDRLYKKKEMAADAGILFDYLEVMEKLPE